MSKEDLQKKYMELQMLDYQMKQVQQQIQAIEGHIEELGMVQNSLDDFGSSKVGSDMFVTLTPGLFVKAKLQESDSVLMNVGGGAVVKKSIPDAKGSLSNQISELRKVGDELADQLKTLTSKAEELQEGLRKQIENV